MRAPDFGVFVPTSTLVKPKKSGFVGHNISEGEIDSPSDINRRKRSNTMTNSNVSNNVSSTSTENVVAPTAAPAQLFTLEEIIRCGIEVKTAPATWKGKAIEAATTGAGVAVGIGVAAGVYALGSLIAGMFGSSVELPPAPPAV